MQCSACRAVYSNGLDLCPRCKTPASKTAPRLDAKPTDQTSQEPQASTQATAQQTAEARQAPSTLIEFPGMARASRPQWRKELSERVREIQERRARDAAREAQETARRRIENPAPEPLPLPAAPQLGLVPPPADAPAPNPLVVAALRRIERARQPPPMSPRSRTAMSGAATAVARVAREQYEEEAAPSALGVADALVQPLPVEESLNKTAEQAREHTLTVVPAQLIAQDAPLPEKLKARRAVRESVADQLLTRLEPEIPTVAPVEEPYDDSAPLASRLAACLIDLVVVAFASSPFAATIELTNGNWADPRVSGSMAGIVVIVMFLYLTAATALAGRTWGMSLVSLRAVDADTGLLPTTRQAITRAIVYMLSLAALGLGVLYALFDAEGRAVHDHLSGTAVVRE